MTVVSQKETLSMKWCLDCHRDPDPHLRDPDLVTQLWWGLSLTAQEKRQNGAKWREVNMLQPSQDCSTCHR